VIQKRAVRHAGFEISGLLEIAGTARFQNGSCRNTRPPFSGGDGGLNYQKMSRRESKRLSPKGNAFKLMVSSRLTITKSEARNRLGRLRPEPVEGLIAGRNTKKFRNHKFKCSKLCSAFPSFDIRISNLSSPLRPQGRIAPGIHGRN
jgi:hypothetical protein